ncbi:MAG: hypothetical protein U1E26_01490 [Coriobacteriia bacterium]|nr:hypothetical protein [Coriobacteriia bacterium]
MCAEQFNGHVVRARLAGGQGSFSMLGLLLDDSDDVIAHDINDRGYLTAFLAPTSGEAAFVRALEASGVYPLEIAYDEDPGFGGPRAC